MKISKIRKRCRARSLIVSCTNEIDGATKRGLANSFRALPNHCCTFEKRNETSRNCMPLGAPSIHSECNFKAIQLEKSYVKVETRGRKQCLNERSLRLLNSYARQNCFESLHSITTKFKNETDITVPVSTVRRYCRSFGLKLLS